MSAPVLSEIRVAAEPEAWAVAGFSVSARRADVGGVALEFVEGDGGIVDWALTDVRRAGIDGLPTRVGSPVAGEQSHPNGVTEIDHVVVATPRLERTIACFEEVGIGLRRLHEGETGIGRRRLAFFRLGRLVLEVVEAVDMDAAGPARFWGITFTTSDIDAASKLLDDKLGPVKDAVQPGRRIATVRTAAGLGLPVALITPKRRE